jgi:aminopeptidase N
MRAFRVGGPARAFGLGLAWSLAWVAGGAAAQEPPPIEAGVAPPPGVYAPGVDVLHYDVEIGLGHDTDWIAGRAEVTVALTADGPTLPLDFTGLEILEVAIDGQAADYTHTDGVLRIPLPGRAAGDTVRALVAYRGVPDDGLILRANVHGERTAFVDNWPNRTRFWLPSVDHPADKATVRFTVHAPAAWSVIANGYRVGEPTPTPPDAIGPSEDRRTWRWEVGVPISPYNMVIGAAEMTVRSVGTAACGRAPASHREDGCVDVTYWSYPEDADLAEPSFRRAAEIVDFFSETVGPFPFEKLANVQSATRFGGMENASAIFYSERAIASGRNIESTASHEIAHQWFGDAVTEADWHHLWLSEGFATYFGALFFEHAEGEADFQRRMEESRRSYIDSNVVDRPVVDPEEHDLFALLNSNNYPKGGWVLHMLRGMLGDDAFFEGIRAYYRRFRHTAVLTEDFQRIMEEASGQDLDWFFEQWIHRPGYPILQVEERWVPIDGTGGTAEVTVRQTQKAAWPRFRAPVDVCWGEGEGRMCRKAELRTGEDVFRFRFDERPAGKAVVDPDGWLLKG